jgi:chromosome partitioning protein
MRTIAVIGHKGGSGKTTVAVNLSLAAHLRGNRTLLADTDPQRSAVQVLRARSTPAPRVEATTGAKLFALKVAALRDDVDILVIDTPSGGEEDMAHAIIMSELCVLVLRPTFLDLAAAARTIDVINRLGKPAFAVFNQAPPRREQIEPPLVRRATEALGLLRLPLATSILRSRLGYQSTLATGRSAEEANDTEAAAEISGLWSYLEQCSPDQMRASARALRPSVASPITLSGQSARDVVRGQMSA